MIADSELWNFCRENGARQVHKTWVDVMRQQGRHIKDQYASWDTLPDRDRVLDSNIAYETIKDFLVWLQSHPHK